MKSRVDNTYYLCGSKHISEESIIMMDKSGSIVVVLEVGEGSRSVFSIHSLTRVSNILIGTAPLTKRTE
jgi:hypothetical protein